MSCTRTCSPGLAGRGGWAAFHEHGRDLWLGWWSAVGGRSRLELPAAAALDLTCLRRLLPPALCTGRPVTAGRLACDPSVFIMRHKSFTSWSLKKLEGKKCGPTNFCFQTICYQFRSPWKPIGSSPTCSLAPRWSRPPIRFVKCNVDAACRPSMPGFSGILRDSDGRFIEGFSGSLDTSDSLLVEYYAILVAVRHLLARAYSGVIIESDALEAITIITTDQKFWPWKYHGILGVFSPLLDGLTSTGVSICFSPRSSNIAAHFMASFAADGPSFCLFSAPPMNLIPILNNDILA